MTHVVMYTKTFCPYCNLAKNLLAQYTDNVEEINLESDHDAFLALCQRTKMRTVPQIFIDEELIGGFDQLNKLHQTNQLITYFE